MNLDEIIIIPPKTATRTVIAKLVCFPEASPVIVFFVIMMLFLAFQWSFWMQWWIWMIIFFIFAFVSFLLALYGEGIGTTVFLHLLQEFVLPHFKKEEAYSFENNGEFQLVYYEIEKFD